MMFLAYLNQLLSIYCGACVVTVCVQVWAPPPGEGEVDGGGEALPAEVRGWRYAPAAAAPTLLLLGLLATAATAAKPRAARTLLIVYGVMSMLCGCLALCVAAWSGVGLWGWARGAGAGRELARDDSLLRWLRPLLPLFAPAHINDMFEPAAVRWEVAAALCCGAALPPLLLLAGVTALCAHCQGRRGANITGTSRSDSLHYESTSIYKIPLNDSAVW